MPQSTRLYSAGKGGGVSGTNPPGLVPMSTIATNNASLPAKQVVTVTTETVILDPAVVSGTIPLILSIPPGGPCEQEPFDVVASGYITTGVSSTVTLKLYDGTSTTVGSDTLLGSSGAITAFGPGTANFKILCHLEYDSVSGKLGGTIQFVVNNQLVAEAAISNVGSGINNVNNPVVSFVLSVTFGTANAGNLINVKDFGVNH